MKGFVILIVLPFYSLVAQVKSNVMVSGFDTLEFYSNVFFVDELAYFNYIDSTRVVPLYREIIRNEIRKKSSLLVSFYLSDSTADANILGNSFVMPVANPTDTFIGLSGTRQQADSIAALLKKRNIDYLLSLNAFEIYSKNPPEKPQYYTPTTHIIHYDLFDSKLNVIDQGKFTVKSNAVEAVYMASEYVNFADEITEKVFKDADTTFQSIYEARLHLKEDELVKTPGLGLSFGLSNYSGLVGLYGSWLQSKTLEFNAGGGIDYNGLNIFGGTKLFLKALKNGSRPFIGLNYGYNTGNNFQLGGETDEFGNQLDPDDVSKYSIEQGHTIYLTAGLRFIYENVATYLSAGYGVAVNNPGYTLTEGSDFDIRDSFVNWMVPGGFQVSLTFIFHQTK